MERTSINCDSPEDSLTLMAVTYALSVMYQLTTRKIGRNLAAQGKLLLFIDERIHLIVSQCDEGLGHQVD